MANNRFINPFTHHLEFISTWDKIRTAIFTITVLPLRLVTIITLLVIAWCLAFIGLYRLPPEDLLKKPIKGWRRAIRFVARLVFRLMWMAAGFYYIRVKGTRVSRKEAPMFVIAPHSSFCDLCPAAFFMGDACTISNTSNTQIPIIGKLISFTQPVHVRRDDANSRQRTIQDIIDRTTSKDDWPQVLIFPEGTCTNRSCLITFKPGAFIPGVPIQPVLIRYPNKLDTVTWTWHGPGTLKLLWLTLTRTYSNCEVEFLPVYNPSEDEKKDAKLYAQNVRTIMAKALGIPTTDYSYEDAVWLVKAEQFEQSDSSRMMKTMRLRIKLGLNKKKFEDSLINQQLETPHHIGNNTFLNKSEFANLLMVDENDELFRDLCDLYYTEVNDAQHDKQLINLKYYLLVVYLSSNGENKNNLIELAFKYFDDELSIQEFKYIMALVLETSNDQSQQMFDDVTNKEKNTMKYDEYLRYVKKLYDFSNEINHFDANGDTKKHT